MLTDRQSVALGSSKTAIDDCFLGGNSLWLAINETGSVLSTYWADMIKQINFAIYSISKFCPEVLVLGTMDGRGVYLYMSI